MATIEAEAQVPVREGVYGDRVAAVEPGSVRRSWKAPLAMAVGIAASIPFWDQGHPIPLGYFPKHYPQIGDLSFFVGFVIAAALYLALNADRVRRRC